MADANVQLMGVNNGVTTDDRALYLKLFSGEVITAFEHTTVTLDKHIIHTIANGKSSQFPVLGDMPEAEYHTPGSEILGQTSYQSERVINIDSLLISHRFIDHLDEAMAHFETRSKYSEMMGQRLARKFDNVVMRTIYQAASAPATVTGGDGGLVITDANLASTTDATKFTAWETALFTAAENFANKNVTGKLWCILKPADYYFLVRYVSSNGFSAINKDYNATDNGSYANGTIYQIAGIELVMSPDLASANYTSDKYHKVDCSNVKALVFTEDAVGTVKLLDVSIQSEWDIRRQGTLMVASYAMGHGILQPECACAFKTA